MIGNEISKEAEKLIDDILNGNRLSRNLEKILNKIDFGIDKSVHVIENSLAALFKLVDSSAAVFLKGVSILLNSINDFYKNNSKLLRHLSLPYSVLIPVVYKRIKLPSFESIPLLVPGLHQVRSKVGGGKSLTSFTLAEYCLEQYGYASYLTSAVEKPQLSEDGKYFYVMHRVIDPKDYYMSGKKIMNYNAKKYPYFHKDERHLSYNPRLNKTKQYNDTWIPEHEDELLMRHDGFRVIIKYSQHMKLDAQEMENLTFMHEVETKKDLTIRNWLKNGQYDFVPVKLVFYTYTIEVEFDGTMKRKFYKKWKLPVTQEILDKYDTLAEKNKHAGLPVDYK